ncbi:uncharacterized protein LOC129791532 [Lutzomyia longipalpis]|uniref:uncharacterized protein LOC129791532 n=1 Tax=Lutzomyia longipalpis TaxID=7200 RepID=UPI0024846BF2|nr:uncharacterized protein LOC129791532 [Lutzomyia longipalpis]
MCRRKCFGLFILAYCIVLVTPQGAFSHGDIIRTFVAKYKQIRTVNLLLCTNTHLIEASRGLMEAGVQVKMQSVEKINVWSDLWDVFACKMFRKIIILDLECEGSERILLELATFSQSFKSCNHWLLLENVRSVPLNVFEQLPIHVSTEIMLATRDENFGHSNATAYTAAGSYWLYDIWSPGIVFGGSLNVTFMGKYEPHINNGNFQLVTHDTTIIRRKNLNLVPLRCMMVITEDLEETFEDYVRGSRKKHLDSAHRFTYTIVTYVKDMFNFSMPTMHSKSWGYPKNGTFDGMIGFLMRGEAELGGSPGYIREERARVVDFTVGIWITRPCFIFRHPFKEGLISDVFIIPFTKYVWISIATVGVIWISFAGYIMYWEGFVENTDGVNGVPSGGGGGTQSGHIASNFIFRNAIKSLGKYFPGNKSKLRRGDDTKGKPNSYDKFKKDGADGVEGSEEAERGGDLLFHPTPATTPEGTHPQRSYRQMGATIRTEATAKAVIANAGAVVGGERSVVKIHNSRRGVIENYEKEKSTNRTVAPARHPTAAERYSRSVILFIRAISQQGNQESPTHVCAGSIAMQILVLFAFFTFQYYSASIVGSLLMEKPKTIKTLRNLIDSNLELGAEDILYTRDFFVRTTDPVAQELFRKRIKYFDKNNQEVENFLRPDVGMPKVKKGGYAFHIDVSAAYKIIRDTFTEREICDLVEIDLFPSYSFMMISMVRKGSPYRKMMIYGMRKTVETGVAYRTKDFYQTPQPKCTRQMKATDLIVNVERLFSAHALLICGFLLSLIVLSVELLYRNLTNRNKARRRH